MIHIRSTYYIIPVHIVVVLTLTRGFGLLSKAKKLERAEKEKLEKETPSTKTATSPTTDDSKKT